MIKNAQEIIDLNLLKLENTHGKPAQIGYDLSLQKVMVQLNPQEMGCVFLEKTVVPELREYSKEYSGGRLGWFLQPGIYEFIFNEGLNNLPANLSAKITQRSSLARNGAFMESSWFDPGFGTSNIGTTLILHKPLYIEENARVAQIVLYQNTPVFEDNMYNGQFQNDKQRIK